MESNLTNKPTAANTFAAALTGQFEKDIATWISKFNDHAFFASQMETQNGANKVVSRRQYRLKNIVNGLFVELYGMEPMPANIAQQRDKNAQLRMYMKFMQDLPMAERYGNDRNTRFAARLNVAYQEQRLAHFLKENPHCDRKSGEYNEVAAGEDLAFSNHRVDAHEARLNYAETLAMYHAFKSLYEHLTGEEYLFQPWTVSDKAPAQKAANARLASLVPDAA